MQRPSARALLIALFLFLYLPFAYYCGWNFLPGPGEDYPSYHYASVLAFGEHKPPYGRAAFDAATQELGRTVHPYLYPPPSLLAFWPLSQMGLAAGKAALLITSHVGYLLAIWLILARFLPREEETARRLLFLALALVYFFAFDPAAATLAVGQINLVALPFLCLALVGMRRQAAAWQIALPLSIAILLKTYPVLFLIPLLFHRRYKAIILTCAFFAAYSALTLLVFPLDIWTTWLREVLPQAGYANNAIAAAGPWNQNINGFISRLLLPHGFGETPLPMAALAKPVATVLGLAVLGVTVLHGYRRARHSVAGGISAEELATYLLMIFLIAPLSWDHHLVYVLPAALLALQLLVHDKVRGAPALGVAAALFLIAWRIPFADPALQHGWLTLLISIKFYPAAGLWLFFLLRLRAAPEISRPDPPATHSEPTALPA